MYTRDTRAHTRTHGHTHAQRNTRPECRREDTHTCAPMSSQSHAMQPVGRTLSTPIFLGVREDEAWVQARLEKVAVKEEKKMEEWIEKMKEQGIDWEVKLEEIDEWMTSRCSPQQIHEPVHKRRVIDTKMKRKDKIHEHVNKRRGIDTHVSGTWPFPLVSADLSHMKLD